MGINRKEKNKQKCCSSELEAPSSANLHILCAISPTMETDAYVYVHVHVCGCVCICNNVNGQQVPLPQSTAGIYSDRALKI